MTRDEIVRKSREAGGMFIVIPSVVKLDTELPLSAQMLYGIITWKCNSYAYTWATNRELGEALGVSAKRVSALLSQLEERGHVETEIEYKDGTREILRRYIYPVMKSARDILEDTPPQARGYLPLKMRRLYVIKKEIKKILPPIVPQRGTAFPLSQKKGAPSRPSTAGSMGRGGTARRTSFPHRGK